MPLNYSNLMYYKPFGSFSGDCCFVITGCYRKDRKLKGTARKEQNKTEYKIKIKDLHTVQKILRQIFFPPNNLKCSNELFVFNFALRTLSDEACFNFQLSSSKLLGTVKNKRRVFVAKKK